MLEFYFSAPSHQVLMLRQCPNPELACCKGLPCVADAGPTGNFSCDARLWFTRPLAFQLPSPETVHTTRVAVKPGQLKSEIAMKSSRLTQVRFE